MRTPSAWVAVPAVLATGVACTLFFEQARWLWFRKRRVRHLRRGWRRRGLKAVEKDDVLVQDDQLLPAHLTCEHCTVGDTALLAATDAPFATECPCIQDPRCTHEPLRISDDIFYYDSSDDDDSVIDNDNGQFPNGNKTDFHLVAADDTRKDVALRRKQTSTALETISRNATVLCNHLYQSFMIAGRFVNPFPEWRDKNATNFWEYLTWRFVRTDRTGLPRSGSELDNTLPVLHPNWNLIKSFHSDADAICTNSEGSTERFTLVSRETATEDDSTMTVTWFGQSTCLVQMDGYNILTDPVFSSRTLGEWFGPKRIRPLPCKLSDIPVDIDLVLISHDHYDHLDKAVVKQLGNSTQWFIPLGLKEWFNSLGVTNVTELDWWQETTFMLPGRTALKVAATPIQHWSGRHFFDVNSTLWCSFVVRGGRDSLFHCGDTGYCGVFQDIGQRYGPFSLALLPIGSYAPRWFMRHQHVDPVEAVRIHKELGARRTLGVHWGTFMMSDEHYLEPPRLLALARDAAGVSASDVFTSQHGRTLVV